MKDDLSSAGMLGGYSPLDGTVEFYGRINAFLKPEFVVADVGAGRAAWFHDDPCDYHRQLRFMKGRVAKVIGLDVDPAITSNPATDENLLITDGRLPLPDASVDVAIADFVLEHVADPRGFEMEIFRILKTGGLFCARTPHSLHYVSIGARLVRNARHATALKRIQPSRKEIDVFATRYRCNTLRRIGHIWESSRWASYSYLYSSEPAYYFGSRGVYRAMQVLHKLLPLAFSANIFMFAIKRDAEYRS